jgi:hypothetical protein
MGESNKLSRLLGLFGFALAIQISFLAILPAKYRTNESVDYLTFYKPVAENILAGKGLVDDNGNFASFYPPGFPLVIAFVTGTSHILNVDSSQGINVFEVISMAVSALLVFCLTTSAFGTDAAFITFLLWVSYPANLWLVKQPNSEVPFILFFLSSLLLFSMAVANNRLWLGLGSGFLVGAAALVRPIAVFIPILYGVAAMLYLQTNFKARTKMLACLAFGSFLAISPWEIYLHSKTGRLPLLATNGSSAMSEGLIFAIESFPNSKPINISPRLSAFMEDASAQRSSMTTSSSVMGFVVKETEKNPGGAFELVLMKFYRPWYATESRRLDNLNLLYQIFYITVGLVGLVIGVRRHHTKIYWIAFFSALIAYFWAMAFLAVPLFRYIVPAMVFVMMFCAFAGEALLARSTGGRVSSESNSVHT